MADQTEKSFQKQEGRSLQWVKKGRAHRGWVAQQQRYYKSIGLGYKTPNSAITGTYVDKKCPFTGNVNIRGRIMRGVVLSTKMKRTLVIRRDYLHYVKKYNRFEKRHSNTPAHVSPAFLVKEGDIVTVGQCRPLSKTVRFNVIKHEPQQEGAKAFRIF